MGKQHPILLIDRNRAWRSELTAYLEQAGFEVYEAAGRQYGLPLMFETHPSLVFLEIEPESEEGWETLSRIRDVTDVPVILMKEHVLESDCERAAAQGANELLPKPISPANLAKCLRTHLRVTSKIKHPPRRRSKETPAASESLPQKLRFLSESQLTQVDQAVMEVGERGEVWLIKSRGSLKYVARVTAEQLMPALGTDRPANLVVRTV